MTPEAQAYRRFVEEFGPTRDDVKHLFRVLRDAFPDLLGEIVAQFSRQDRVGTHRHSPRQQLTA